MREKESNNMLVKAFDIFSNKFKTILILTLIFYIPFYLLSYIGDKFATKTFINSLSIAGFVFGYGEIFSIIFVTVLNFIFSPIFMGSIYILVIDYINNEEIDYKSILKKSIRLWPIFFISIVMYYILVFSSIWCIIVTPFIITIFYFNTFAICEGKTNPIEALKTSFRSLKGKILVSFGIILMTSILNTFIGNILFSLVNLSNMPANILFFVFYNTINTIISAYFYIFLSLWYKDVYDSYITKIGIDE